MGLIGGCFPGRAGQTILCASLVLLPSGLSVPLACSWTEEVLGETMTQERCCQEVEILSDRKGECRPLLGYAGQSMRAYILDSLAEQGQSLAVS